MKTRDRRRSAAGWVVCVCALLWAGVAVAGPAPDQDAGFRVLDIGERTYGGGPAIAVILSAPLDPTLRHDKHIRISDTQELLKSAWVLSEDGRTLYFPHVEPETEYTVTVLPSLQASDGRTLSDRTSQAVTTRAVAPVVSFASDGMILPAGLTDGLPVVTVNIPRVNVEFFRLNDAALVHFVTWGNITGRKGYYKLEDAIDHGELVYTGQFDLDPPRNRRVVRHLPVEGIEALAEPGVYFAVMREPGEYAYTYQSTYFLVTDIGLHSRFYADSAAVFASSLQTGKALADVELTFLNSEGKSIHTGVTDDLGRYRYGHRLPGDAHVIVARHGGQVGALPLKTPALDMSDFDLGTRPYRPKEIFTYGPRDLYRPGETVVVSALIRDDDGEPVTAMPLTARLLRPDGKEAKRFTWHPEPLESVGYYETQIDLAADAPTGKWRLNLFTGPAGKTPAAVFAFQVEEFLPERMKLDLAVSPERPRPDDDLQVAVSGRYLYGAPAAGNRVTAKVLVRAKRELIEDLSGFVFGRAGDADYKDYWEIEETSLDERGETVLAVGTRWDELESPLSVYVITSLYESGGRPVTRTASATVWPAESLVGIRPRFDDGNADEGPVSFEIVRADRSGAILPADRLDVTLTREDRDYYWEYSESTGWEQRYTEKHYQYLADDLSLDGGNPTPYTVQLRRGQYLLALTDPATGRTTSLRFRVGHWWYGRDAADAARPDKVVLTLDRKAYRPGDVAEVTVTPPHDGEAIVTVEGTEPLWLERTPVSASGTTVSIPISARWTRHDLHVSAVVFRPADADEKITPNRAVGLIHLPLHREDRRLDLTIEAPDKVVPQRPLDVDLRLGAPSATDGAPVYVTLAAVDVGILNITDFETPDPHEGFFGRRRFSVTAHDVYGQVIEMMDGQPAGIRFGGDADLAGGKKPESKVRLVSLFHAPVAFDEAGHARVTLDVPDFNGQLRLMALAFDERRFGSAEAEVTVAAPVVTQLSTPRFLAPGDHTTFTLDVHNISGADGSIDLTLSVTEPLSLDEPGDRSLQLADGEKTTVRFPVSAGGAFGAGNIRLKLDGAGVSLDRSWQLGVRPPYPAEARRLRDVLEPGETFMLDDRFVADLIPETVTADVKISPVVPLDLRDAMKGLITYPYGCLEQVTSRAFPLLLATPDRIAKYRLPDIGREERLSRLDDAISRLSAMQLPSGGFGLWNRTSPESPWLSAYVTDFLLSARDLGVDVPEAMLDAALKRMTAYLKRGAPVDDYYGSGGREALEMSARCYAADVLARVGRAELGPLRTLFDNHQDKAVSPLPLAQLGIALETMGDRKRSRECLAAAAEKRRETQHYLGDYGSPVRDLALTLARLLERDKGSTPGFDEMMLDLADQLRGRRWLSTQEKYAVFTAGLALDAVSDRDWRATLAVGETRTPLSGTGPHLLSPTVAEVTSGLEVTAGGPGILYVSAVASGYPSDAPAELSEGMSVDRTVYNLEGELVEPTELKVGELLMVHLRVSADQFIPDALVVDLLPAGLEIENQNLKHSIRREDLMIDGDSLWRVQEQADVLHEEFRDDRYAAAVRVYEGHVTHLFYLVRAVSPGTYTVPPPFAESMYQPEKRAIGVTPPPIRVINEGGIF